MPARSNIAIGDGETTPVTHTFTPDGDVGPGHARFVNRNSSVPAASEYLFVRVTKGNSPATKVMTAGTSVNPDVVESRIKYPSTYTDSVTGLTLVDFVDEVQIKRMCHPRSSEQRRKNLRMLSVNLLMYHTVAWDKTETYW